jgi:hypothetical protein
MHLVTVPLGIAGLVLIERIVPRLPADAGPHRVALVVIAAVLMAGVLTGLRMPRDAGQLARSGIAR